MNSFISFITGMVALFTLTMYAALAYFFLPPIYEIVVGFADIVTNYAATQSLRS